MRLSEIKALVETTSDPSFAVGGSGCIAAWNIAAETMFALPACDAIGRQCHEIVNGTDEYGAVCSAECGTQQAVLGNEAVGNFDMQIQMANGMQWCSVSVLTTEENNSKTRYSIHLIHAIDVGKRIELLMRNFVASGTGLLAEQAAALISSASSSSHGTKLSARERDVLRLLAKGVTTKAAAEQLHISSTTVKNHVQRILRKLGSHTRMEAIHRAQRAGLI